MASGNNFTCVCGFHGNSGHAGKCSLYNTEIKQVGNSMKEYVAARYKVTYSVTDCCEYIVRKEKTLIKPSAIRKQVTSYLDLLGLIEGPSGVNRNRARSTKFESTMKSRYGVINPGQMEGHGFSESNKIPYVKLKVSVEYNQFRKDVDKLTTKVVEQLKKTNQIPKICYYTQIEFNDTVLAKVNPNDPMKRTVDHKIPVTEAFFRGWTVEKTCDITNLVFCLRVVNTMKGHLNERDFKKLMLPLLIKRLENESQIS